jgi:hypothetical protein
MAPEQGQRDHCPERVTYDVGPLHAEGIDESCQGVAELRCTPALVDVGRLAEARCVPSDDGVVSREVSAHPLPRAAVTRRTVQHNQRRPDAGSRVGNPHPVDVDVTHAWDCAAGSRSGCCDGARLREIRRFVATVG